MDQLQHFSHEHLLTLISEAPSRDESEPKVLCFGCQKPILGCAYTCSECSYFLHKKCAELEQTINHPRHPQHPLALLAKPPYASSACICNLCKTYNWEWFTYHCSKCGFDIDIRCLLEEQGVIEHEGHHHPLMFIKRPAFFLCDACNVRDENSSYRCSTCSFWIHERCASLPTTIKRPDHDVHPLNLTYNLPDIVRNFGFSCIVCHKKVLPNYWAYHCADCRYFIHLKCSLPDDTSMLRSETSEIKDAEDERCEIEAVEDLVHLPLPDGESLNRITQFIEEANLEDEERVAELTHFSHEHPLHLSGVPSDSKAGYDEIICNGCVRPIISNKFYVCDECNFYLHTSCASLPHEAELPCLPEHWLRLKIPKRLTFPRSTCIFCNIYSNGLSYTDTFGNFKVDVNCARTSFPKRIKHESHKHPLKIQTLSEYYPCNGCGDASGPFKYGCETCGFYLHNYCARLPKTISHSWDHHPISLIYPPFSNHPDEFICEICEQEMHPSIWLYHCRDCDQSFHYKCVRPFQTYSNFKFGDQVTFKVHPHILTFVPQSKNKYPSSCHLCGVYRYGIPISECAPCNFIVCFKCIFKH